MRIAQGYVSKSIMSFPFHQIYALDDYNDSRYPAVFFGMYRYEDYQLMCSHVGEKKIFWTGQDALDFDFKDKYHCNNVTAHPKIHAFITAKGYECELVKPAAFLNEINPQKLGPKIYAYCPKEAEDYHGKKVLDELRLMGYDILIGDGSIPQSLWKHSSNGFYNDIFVGLCLSDFAGGGGSIIEMGLRGIPVVTNVFDLYHCIPWTNAKDIAYTIEILKPTIGTTFNERAEEVWNGLDHEYKWLEI